MKKLKDYTDAKLTKLFDALGVFFAFSADQVNEKKVDGVKYAMLGAGIFCPADNVSAFNAGYDRVLDEGIKQDIEENGADKIIERELRNYEAFYTCEIDDAVDALKCYGFTWPQVQAVYKKVAPTVDL